MKTFKEFLIENSAPGKTKPYHHTYKDHVKLAIIDSHKSTLESDDAWSSLDRLRSTTGGIQHNLPRDHPLHAHIDKFHHDYDAVTDGEDEDAELHSLEPLHKELKKYHKSLKNTKE